MTAHVPERPKRGQNHGQDRGPEKRSQQQLINEMVAVQCAEWVALDMVFTDKVDAIGKLLITMIRFELGELPEHLNNPASLKRSSHIAVSNALIAMSKQAKTFLDAIK